MYSYISTLSLCVYVIYEIGIDEDVRLENWQRSTKQQCNTHSKQASEHEHEKADGRAQAHQYTSTNCANERVRARALTHSPSLACLPAYKPARSPARSHTTLMYTLCINVHLDTHVLVHCERKSQKQRYCVENDNV